MVVWNSFENNEYVRYSSKKPLPTRNSQMDIEKEPN